MQKRNQLNPARHTTYMNQATRKERSFEQIKGELANIEEGSSSMIEVESGVFVSTKGVKDLVNPTDEELFRLAGGSLDMKNLGKKGIDYRTILAKRVRINSLYKYLRVNVSVRRCISKKNYTSKLCRRD